jgi:hypothetical protein
MNTIPWLAVIALSVEAVFFGNGTALLAGLVITAIGMFLEKKEKA